MAITNYLVHFKTEATYESNKDQLRNDAVAFVKDATIIHTHGTDYYCGSSPVALESDLANYATTSALTSGLASKANTSHTHSISQISGLQGELDSKLESVSLADLGITATATELNYVDGVTSSIQTQLNNKVSLVDGVLTLSGNSSTGNAINLNNNEVQDLNIVSNENNIIIKSGTTSLKITSNGINIDCNDNDLITLNGTAKTQRIHSLSPITISCYDNELKISDKVNGLTFNDSIILTEDNWDQYITATTDTTGSSQYTSKLFLVGAVNQSSEGVKTYSNSNVYIENNGVLNASGLEITAGDSTFSVADDYVTWFGDSTLLNTISFNVVSNAAELRVKGANGSESSLNGGIGYFSDKVNAKNGFFETSDSRLKNFHFDVQALDVIENIPTKYYNWKTDSEEIPMRIGTSAQEIQKLYPDLVSENEEGILSVDYARLSIIAIAAIKELKAEINELKSKLN